MAVMVVEDAIIMLIRIEIPHSMKLPGKSLRQQKQIGLSNLGPQNDRSNKQKEGENVLPYRKLLPINTSNSYFQEEEEKQQSTRIYHYYYIIRFQLTAVPRVRHLRLHQDMSFRKRRKLRQVEWRLYGQGNQRSFQKDDFVVVKPKSRRERGIRGRLVERIDDCKWKLIDHNEKQLAVYEKRLIPVFHSRDETALSVLITSETIHYRHLAASQIDDQDAVLEIGCSTGETSEVVWKYAKSWVGFDTSTQMMERTSSKYASSSERTCRFLCQKMNALVEPENALHVVNEHQATSVVFMDIGGNREMNGVARMMHWILTCSFPKLRLIVLKSEEFFREMSDQCVLDAEGFVDDGSAFLETKLLSSRRLPTHPLQAPKAYSPMDSSLAICRYHNYHEKGCLKGNSCPFDHVHCHMCLNPGHIAKNCNRIVTS